MKIHIHELKSSGNPAQHTVRVFVNYDFHYGYWVEELELFTFLTAEQRATYLASLKEGKVELQFDVSTEVAQRIIDVGATPFTKPQVA